MTTALLIVGGVVTTGLMGFLYIARRVMIVKFPDY